MGGETYCKIELLSHIHSGLSICEQIGFLYVTRIFRFDEELVVLALISYVGDNTIKLSVVPSGQ